MAAEKEELAVAEPAVTSAEATVTTAERSATEGSGAEGTATAMGTGPESASGRATDTRYR